MNNYDGSRENEMNEVLNFLYKMSDKRFLNKEDVYNVLCYYNLKSSDRPKDFLGREVFDGKSNLDMFNVWIDRFHRKENIRVFVDPSWSYFVQFVNRMKGDEGEFIKLYIPLDYDHLYDGANILFDFLARNNIAHESKISKKVRVDNVIIRLKKGDIETAKKIINFIKSNPYLRSGLNKTNPFVPTINGIGIMNEHGNSYNSDISHYIANYINKSRQRKQGSVSASEFREFLLNCQRNNIVYSGEDFNFDDSLLSTFEIAYSGKKKDLNQTNREENKLTPDEKKQLFYDAINATYQKYNLYHIKVALNEAIKNKDYGYITNGGTNRYRDRIIKSISSTDMLNIISDFIKKSYPQVDMARFRVEDRIEMFCNMYFSRELTTKLENICNVTLENYDELQVETALKDYIFYGSVGRFSRYKGANKNVNYREQVLSINREQIANLLSTSLANRGIETQNLQVSELCRAYAKMLMQEKQQKTF